MFRNQYDNDVGTWSPQGRIHQIEYAMEAVKQGSATIGIKSKTHVVLVALKRSTSELSSYQKKIYPIDDHMAVSIAGLTSDGRLLSKFMRTECLNSRYVFDMPLPVSRLVAAIGDKMQVCTQVYGRRPYGVGMLVAGYDSQGPHLYQTCPSSNYYDCKAMAIGARSQSARTYLEKQVDQFLNCSLEELIHHGLIALRECLPSDAELTEKNVSIGVVGHMTKMEVYDDDKVKPYDPEIHALFFEEHLATYFGRIPSRTQRYLLWVTFLDALDTRKGGRVYSGAEEAEQGEGLMEQEAPPAAEGTGDQGDQQGPQVMEDS